MLMERLIIYITFIPWLLCYGFNIRNNLKSTKNIKFNFKWFKKNLPKMIYFEEILLIAIFIYFSTYDNKTVNEMLFSVMNLYLFVNTFYNRRAMSNNKLDITDLSTILIIVIISFGPYFFFIKTNNLIYTYYILFGYIFFSYLITIFGRFIDFLLKKVFKSSESK